MSSPSPEAPRTRGRVLRVLGHPRAPVALGVALSILALVQANHRAGQGRSALLKWEPDFVAFWSGAELYGVGAEGYPTLPVTLVLMEPFRALGDAAGPLAWAALKVAVAWWLIARAFALASDQGAGERRPLPAFAQLLVVVLSFRVLLSDVLHGNLNLLIGATVAAAGWSWAQRRDLACGAWLGFGAALKVTPALGLLFLLWKRSGRGALGFVFGVAFGALLPAVFVGWERTLELDAGWWRQMVVPYLEGRELTLLQTEHINQSLFGVLARLLTDSVAIAAGPDGVPPATSVHLASVSAATFAWVHRAASLVVVALWLGALGPRAETRRGHAVLGEFALLALAMVFLSERSWKHHYVLLAWPITYLVADALASPGDPRRRPARIGLVLAALLFGATGEAFLGDHGSNLAEAYGVYLLGGLALFVPIARSLRSGREAA